MELVNGNNGLWNSIHRGKFIPHPAGVISKETMEPSNNAVPEAASARHGSQCQIGVNLISNSQVEVGRICVFPEWGRRTYRGDDSRLAKRVKGTNWSHRGDGMHERPPETGDSGRCRMGKLVLFVLVDT